MLTGQQRRIIELLLESDYTTAKMIAYILDISVKTVRNRIKEINEELSANGLSIHSRPQQGYSISEEQKEKFEQVLEKYDGEESFIPSTTQERVEYLTLKFLKASDYIRLDDLSEKLYISRSTLNKALHMVRNIYEKYGLSLQSKPYAGLKISGKEENIRQAINDILNQSNHLSYYRISKEKETEIQELGRQIYPVLQEQQLKIPEVSFNSLMQYLALSADRIKEGNIIEFELNEDLPNKIVETAQRVYEIWSSFYQIEVPKEEVDYIALQLSGSRLTDYNRNYVIHSELDKLVMSMLDLINRDYYIDLRNNFDLRMFLNQHMVALDIRLKYNMHLTNPLLEEIKRDYRFAYTLTKSIAFILEDYYGEKISDDELGYFAVLFELAISSRKQKNDKKSVLLINSPDSVNTNFLKYKYQTLLSDYIDKLYVRSSLDLDTFDTSKIDYILTTVPIHQSVNVPILQVDPLPSPGDLESVKKILHDDSRSFLEDFYKSEFFFTDIEGKNKEEVLSNLIRRTGERAVLPKGFKESVFKREELSSTDYGGLIAIPHPYEEEFTEDTVVSVAVLKEPVFWGRNDVQLVILTSIGKNEKGNVQNYFEATIGLISKKAKLKELFENKDFKTFMDIIKKNDSR